MLTEVAAEYRSRLRDSNDGWRGEDGGLMETRELWTLELRANRFGTSVVA